MISAHRGRKATGDYQKPPGGPEAKLLLERAARPAPYAAAGALHGEGATESFRERTGPGARSTCAECARASGALHTLVICRSGQHAHRFPFFASGTTAKHDGMLP